MRAAGRSKWNDDDWNQMCEVQERLIAACYGRDDDVDPWTREIRFNIASHLEQQGDFDLDSDFGEVLASIESGLDNPTVGEAA